MIWLLPAFLVTALLYASVGFGGGSTYSALLALSGVDYRILPLIALSCNIVVVTGSTIRFARAGVTPWRGALLLTAIAAPAVFLGGLTPVSESLFLSVLGASLLLTALSMLLPIKSHEGEPHASTKVLTIVVAPIGYLAGLVGIGGGIFLAPLLHLLRWKEPRAIAATASLFIIVNSLAGMAGQLLKGGEGRLIAAIDVGLPLIIAVAIGGQIGSLLALKFMPRRWIRWGTALLTAWVGARLVFEF